jgi:hypothetical protein
LIEKARLERIINCGKMKSDNGSREDLEMSEPQEPLLDLLFLPISALSSFQDYNGHGNKLYKDLHKFDYCIRKRQHCSSFSQRCCSDNEEARRERLGRSAKDTNVDVCRN